MGSYSSPRRSKSMTENGARNVKQCEAVKETKPALSSHRRICCVGKVVVGEWLFVDVLV